MPTLFVSLFLSLLCFCSLYSQTIIDSNINTNTSWSVSGSPYIVTTDISISGFSTLTIDPGVTVLADSGVHIYVQGDLIAIGTATDSITFSSANRSLTGSIQPVEYYDWSGLVVNGNGLIHLEYVNASLAHTFLVSYIGWQYQLILRHSRLIENYITIIHSPAPNAMMSIDSCYIGLTRIGIADGENVEIRDTQFEELQSPFYGKNALIHSCTFLNCQYALSVEGGEIIGCHFEFTSPQPTGPGINSHFAISSSPFFTLGYPQPLLIQQNTIYTPKGILINGFPDSLLIQNNTICTDSVSIFMFGDTNTSLEVPDNCWCSLDSASIHAHILDSNFVAAAFASFLPIDSSCVPSSVYPGDANHDQIVNHVDLLPIGLHYGTTGPIRANASLIWSPQPADSWGDSLLSTGADLKHVDCDGNGIIDADDTLAISLNYLQVHNSNRPIASSSNGIPFFAELPADPISPGDTIHIPVVLGTVDTQAVDVYGIAFSLSYDSTMIKEGQAWVDYSGSWLGNKNIDLLTFHRDIDSLEQIDLALVKNDQMDVSGFGKIAEIIIVVDDDIFKREVPFLLTLDNVYAIDGEENILVLDVRQGVSVIEASDTTIINGISPELSASLNLYPNPTDEEVIVSLEQEEIEEILIFNAKGQLIQEQSNIHHPFFRLTVHSFSQGLYLVQVKTRAGIAMRKLMIK